MNTQDIRRILFEASPESLANAERQDWFLDAMSRVAAISAAQHDDYIKFGCSPEIADRLVTSVISRLSAYFATESGYKRLVATTNYLVAK